MKKRIVLLSILSLACFGLGIYFLNTEKNAAAESQAETARSVLETISTTEEETESVPETAVLETEKEEDPLLTLVNINHPVPENWTVDLKKVGEAPNEHWIDARAWDDLQAMMNDAKTAGMHLVICSSWRSHETQERLFAEEVQEHKDEGYTDEEAEKLAAEWVAVPGTSEHELGLAVDIVAEEYQMLEEEQKNTPEQMWLMEHCYEYGFILRYTEDKKDITGIWHEPWHYRYVGREAALEIKAMNVCLEEYVLGTGSLTQ